MFVGSNKTVNYSKIMGRLFTSSYCFLFLLWILAGCQKKNFDDYYARPDGIGAPIYQQLQSRGNFSHLLALVDKAGYKDILSSAGWWTMFAPNNAAFDKYFQEKGISGVDVISAADAAAIVKYSLVYNGYRKDQLSTYQSGGDGMAGLAFKRKTAYYDGIQQAGDDVHTKVVATNRNVTSRSGVNASVYVDGDNNNKYLPYFTDLFLSTNSLSETDYQAFYPNSTFSGFNVAGASVVTKDLAAENGMIHETDKVITPVMSLDQYLSNNPDYSEFKSLLDSLRYYTANAYQTHVNFVATGSTDSVYVKGYNGLLAFSPNNENYQKPGITTFFNTEAQKSSWTLIAPTNQAFLAYRKKILSKYENSFFKTAPTSIVIDFLNSQMWAEPLWPSKFKIGENYQLEEATMELSDAVDKKMLSNGLFYGVSKVQEANVFRMAFGVPYLDPKASITLQAYIDPVTGIKAYTTQPGVKQTLLIMPNDVLAAAGWRFNESSATGGATAWGYKAPSASSYSHTAFYKDNILRMMRTGVLITPEMAQASFAGTGIIETQSGDYVKYNNGKIQTSGTVDSGTDLNVSGPIHTENGEVYYVDGMLSYTEENVGQHLEDLATKYPQSYGSFFWLVKNSTKTIYNASTKAISGVNTGIDNKYTILVPDNAAIVQAVKDGMLPGNVTTGALITAAPSDAQAEVIRRFILYHIINGESIVTDGRKADNYLTLYQTEAGDNTLVNVLNDVDNMIITDRAGRSSKVTVATSNQLSNRTIFHSINNYLNYTKP